MCNNEFDDLPRVPQGYPVRPQPGFERGLENILLLELSDGRFVPDTVQRAFEFGKNLRN